MNEGKRGFKNKKQVLAPEKPRNFVAKNATTGGAGAHKDKKKAEKQGDHKHKKAPMADMLEGTAYDRKLELQLKIAVTESLLNERDPAAYAKAAQKSIFQNIGAGAMRDPSDPARIKADRNIANRERGLERQRSRYMAKQPERDALAAQQKQQAIEADKANLPGLTRELEQMEKRFNPNYEYADNHTVWSTNKALHQQILALKARIARAQGGTEEGYHVYSEFDGGKDEPYQYQYTGHTFSDRNSASLKAQELDDSLDYGGSQQFHRHIVKDRHPHVRESKINELSDAAVSNYNDKADMDIVKAHRVRGPQAAAGDKESVAKTDKRIDKRMKGINAANSRLTKGTKVDKMAEGQGDFDKAINNLHGWYEVDSSNPDIKEYEFDDREGGYYAQGTVKHSISTGRVKIEFEDRSGQYGEEDINQTFNSIGDAMNVLRTITTQWKYNNGKAQNYNKLGGRDVAGPNDLYKTDRAGKKGTLTKSRMDTMKATSPSRVTGPKGPLPEGDIEPQHGDTKPWAYWGYPERVAKKLYQIYKGQPVGKAEVVKLWKEDGPDRMTKFMLKPDLSAILSAYEQMSDSGPLFKEGSTPTDPKAPTQVRDRKTGKMYNPSKEFDKTMNSPEVKAQMKRMAQKESVAVLKQMIAEGKILDFLPPFKSMGRYVDDRRGNTIIEASDDGVAKELAGLLNKAFPPRQATGIAK